LENLVSVVLKRMQFFAQFAQIPKAHRLHTEKQISIRGYQNITPIEKKTLSEEPVARIHSLNGLKARELTSAL